MGSVVSHRWWRCVAVVLTAIGFFSLTFHAAAKAPMQKNQAPGFYRMMLGRFEVTALCDGLLEADPTALKNITPSDVKKLLARSLIFDFRPVPISTNAYLVNTGDKLVLIDAGGGSSLLSGLGGLQQALKASGYKPEQVDAVLITHLHGDHFAGLIDANGKPAFPNATVYISKTEHDHWFGDTEPKDVPKEYLDYFRGIRKRVRDTADAYRKLGHWKVFADAKLPIAGFQPIATPGHTPGHTSYEIESDGRRLLFLGDIIHFGPVQFPRPDVYVFDANPKQAVASREALFRRVADGKTLVAGMHLPFPGIGRLRADGKNAYGWIPIDYSPVLNVK